MVSHLHRKENKSSASTLFWELKDKNTLSSAKPLKKKSSHMHQKKSVCTLCLDEKYQILTKAPPLNRRKVFSLCVHKIVSFYQTSIQITGHYPQPSNENRMGSKLWSRGKPNLGDQFTIIIINASYCPAP